MKKLGNKIVKVASIDRENLSVRLHYADGSSLRVSLRHIFSKPKGLAAEILKGGMFEQCFVESGALAWPNGFELCPDALRMWGQKQAPSSHKKQAA
jgi:hypothetical protein